MRHISNFEIRIMKKKRERKNYKNKIHYIRLYIYLFILNTHMLDRKKTVYVRKNYSFK